MDALPADLTIGFPRESRIERRTVLTPALARSLIAAGFGVVTEPGIGAGVFIGDEEYAAAGVRLAEAEQVWSAPLLLRYKSPDPDDLLRLRTGQHIAALFHAEGDAELLTALQDCGATAWSYEFVIENGCFPLGQPGGRIAGVQAVLAGAHALQTSAGRGVLLAAVDGAERANVVVIGSGNVGAAAAETAAMLGADVTVLTRAETSRTDYLRRAPGGIEVLVNSRDTLLRCLGDADLVIGAILVSTYDTPPMIGEADLAVMRPGAVIIDATCGYGSGYLPTAGPVQAPGEPPRLVAGILHVKIDVFPALVPVTATAAYVANAMPYLVRLAEVALLGAADAAIEAARIACAGHLVHPVLIQHAKIYGMRP
ncbi:alanine dehydrogenase [Acrocarpospora macrocephala]|uniref:Alanine dehydrogenase n=1 Tax=Acrocarpospora macrocephala TaxID=150177 RepID=A0A5M3WCY4_9ACTN|nr:NAD(P)-dependent oxidoreductase [Acrocarpospora macrocephala]GES06927.1 alanine dehydrogenase [Acrocarpospora macrocephala]